MGVVVAPHNFHMGVAESWDDFAQFRTNYQWFHPPIHPAFMQCLHMLNLERDSNKVTKL